MSDKDPDSVFCGPPDSTERNAAECTDCGGLALRPDACSSSDTAISHNSPDDHHAALASPTSTGRDVPPEAPAAAPSLLSPALPGPGFWRAAGWILIFVLLQAVAGGILALPLLVPGEGLDTTWFFLLESVAGLGVALAIIRFSLGSSCRRALAIRGLGPLHLLLVVLLAVPLVVVDSEISNWTDEGIAVVVGTGSAEEEGLQSDLPLDRSAPMDGDTVDSVPPSAAAEEATSSRPPSSEDRLAPLRQFLDELKELVGGTYGEIAAEPWLVVLLVGCFFPAVCEELFFRGFLGRGLVARHGLALGSLFTALFFGLMHLHPTNVVMTILMGLVLQLVYLATKSLLVPMLLHFLNNLLAFGLAKLAANKAFDLFGMHGSAHVATILFLSSLAMVAVIVWLLYESRVGWVTPGGTPWAPGYLTAEMPPPAAGAIARRGRLRASSSLVALLVFLGFGASAYLNGLEGSDSWTHSSRGFAASSREDHQAALEHFTRAIRLDPENANLYHSRGLSYEELGRLNEAIADYDQAIRLNPDRGTLYGARGRAYTNKGDYDRAIADLSQAIRINPEHARGYLDRAGTNRRRGELELALADCEQSIRLDSSDSFAHLTRAWILEDLRREREAISAYSEVIRLDGSDAYAYECRARLLHRTGATEQALADLDAILRIDPTSRDAVHARAWMRSEAGQFEGALADYTRGLKLDADCARCYNGRAWLLATCPEDRLRDGRRAVADAERACQLSDWQNAAIIDTLAAAYAEAGEFDKAVHWQQRAIELTSDESREELQTRLELYRCGKPYREAP